ncbi:reverse transcriptase domain-containing protein [Tanacetum coccineum]
MERTYTWIEAKEVATNGTLNDRQESSGKFTRNSFWENNKGRKNRDRFSLYQEPNHILLSNLSKRPREILETEKVARTFEQPPHLPGSKRSHDMSKYWHFHKDHGHDRNQCQELRHQIEEAVKSGRLAHLVKEVSKGKVKVLDTQLGEWKKGDRGNDNSSDLVIIKARISERQVNRVYMDSESSCEVIYEQCFLKLKPSIRSIRVDSKVPLISFSREHSLPLGEVPLEITMGEGPFTRMEVLDFVIVRSNSPHNLILERTAMQKMGIVVSTIHKAIKFHTSKGVGTVLSTYKPDKTGEGQKKLKETSQKATNDILSCMNAEEEIVINHKYLDQTIIIGRQLPTSFMKRLWDLLKANAYILAWTYSDMTGIPRTIMERSTPQRSRRANKGEHPARSQVPYMGIKPYHGKKGDEELDPENTWKLYTDGASSSDGFGAGLILVNHEGREYTYALRFEFQTTNNKVEYEALLAGLRIAVKMKIQDLDIFVDFQLVANQVK